MKHRKEMLLLDIITDLMFVTDHDVLYKIGENNNQTIEFVIRSEDIPEDLLKDINYEKDSKFKISISCQNNIPTLYNISSFTSHGNVTGYERDSHLDFYIKYLKFLYEYLRKRIDFRLSEIEKEMKNFSLMREV